MSPVIVPPAVPDRLPTGPSVRQFDLLRWFSRVSLVASALISTVLALVMAQYVERLLLRHDAELSRQFVQSIVASQDVTRYFGEGDASGQRAAFAEFFGHVASMPDVLRANVYGADGTVLWSSDAGLIGQRFERNDELDEALAGATVVERGPIGAEGDDDKAEHRALAAPGTHFVENYLPVLDERRPDKGPIGVIELYRVPTSLNQTLRNASVFVWCGALLAGLLLYLSTLGLVRQARALMRAQNERLIEAEAMARTGEIAASIAHSIRNPLASIRSSAELQQEIGDPGPDGARETIMHVDRIEQLVRSLLGYVHHPSAVQGRADVAATLRQAEARYGPVFRSQGKRLAVEVGGPLPPVLGEEIAIAQVVDSLVTNALEATAAGGEVVLSARPMPGEVQLEVRDSGSGFAPDRLGEAFKPFSTSKPHGLGLGLVLVKRTLDRLGGRIELQSRPGRTCAIVRLPVADEE